MADEIVLPDDADENKLRDVFGKPEEGVHAATIPVINLALVDTVGTVIIAYGISRYFDINFGKALLGTFITGEVAHYAFGVETRFIKAVKAIHR